MMKTVQVTDAEPHFLAMIEEVNKNRESLLITQANGTPIVRILPVTAIDPLSIYRFEGFDIVGDIESPANDLEDWEYD